MQSEPNPYESPRATGEEIPSTDIRRPALGTFLIGLWVFEGGFKVYVLVYVLVGAFLRGIDPLQYLAAEYRSWNRLVFFLASTFVMIETIGPWIGVYYLTGRRSRTIPFGAALFRTLMVAGGVALIATSMLMLWCELAGTSP
jgi:hypothetical protein